MLLKSVSSSTSSMEKPLSKMTVIFQLMGIQYFSISPESFEATSRTSRTDSLNRKFKWIFVVNIVMTMCEFCGYSFAIHLLKLENKKGNVATGQIVQFIGSNFMIVMLVATLLNSLLLRSKARQIFTNFKIISKTLLTLNQCVDYETFANECTTFFSKLLLCFIGSTSVALIFVFLRNNTNALLWAMLAIYPTFFMVVVFSYWTFLVRLIREHLRSVKDSLVQLQKNLNIFRIHPGRSNSDSRMRRNHETHNFFAKLKRIYGIIYETSLLVNEFIAVPICLIIIFVVIVNISGGYKAFLSLRNDVPAERLVSPIYTICITVTCLCMLIFSCSSTYATTDDVLTQLHKLEFSRMDTECELSTILGEFSLRIVHQPIQFTVGGFCYLTQPLLATIVTGVMTYVMLLVQFSSS